MFTKTKNRLDITSRFKQTNKQAKNSSSIDVNPGSCRKTVLSAELRKKLLLRRKTKPQHHKDLPIHIASATGNKGALKKIISTLSRRALEIKDKFGRTPLVLAVSNNHIDCCAVLLKAGVNPDNTDNSGQTALHIAASKGFHQCVKHLLSYKASWIQRDYAGATALHMAATFPVSKGLLMVLKHVTPAEIDIQDCSLKTALHWSAAYVCNNNIKVLLSRNANPCIPDENGQTPLHWAAVNPEIEALPCVKTLLKDKSCLINWQDYRGRAPLHLAVSCGSEESVYFLASWEKSNVDIIDNHFLTPLHYAAKRGFAEKADILLKKRANHLSIDDNGAMPLHYAAYNNHPKTVAVFTNKKYIYDEPDKYGRSALIWAATQNSVAALKVLATAYGTSTFLATADGTSTFTDRKGYSALHVAAMHGNASSIEVLVNAGMNIDSKDKNGMTPFLKACEFGRSKAGQKLLDLGANMNETDNFSLTGLHWCARGGHAFLADILLKRGAKNDITDNFGMTPLHHAGTNGDYVNCTCVLVESGANLHIADKEGKTPLHCAVLDERSSLVKYFCEQGAKVNAMFRLYEDWATSYDCAIFRCNMEIAEELESWGAIQIQDIKAFALKLIWSWYRRRSKHYKAVIYRKVTKHVCQLCSVEDMKKRGLVFICNDCFHKYSQHYIRKRCKKSADNCNVLNVPVLPYKLLELCERPYTCSGLVQLDNNAYKGSLFHVVCTESASTEQFPYKHRDTAAKVIQRAWRKYIAKKRFSKIRNRVYTRFRDHGEFKAAEERWQLKLQEFLQNFKD